MNMTCEGVRNLVDIYQEKLISREGSQVILAHLKECPECSRYYKLYAERKASLSELDDTSIFMAQTQTYRKLSQKLRRRHVLRIVGTSAAIGAGTIMLAVGILLTCRYNAESLMKK